MFGDLFSKNKQKTSSGGLKKTFHLPGKPQTNQSEDSEETLKLALTTAIPSKDDYWPKTTLSTKISKQHVGIMGMFRKDRLSSEQIMDFHSVIMKTPTKAQGNIEKQLQIYPGDPNLRMLLAISRHVATLNKNIATDHRLAEQKIALYDAVNALSNDGISFYNCENFVGIYFAFLDCLKRAQIKAHGMISKTPNSESITKKLERAMSYCDFLKGEKDAVLRIIMNLKRSFRTSTYCSSIDFIMIKMAAQSVSQGKENKEFEVGTARDVVTYIYAISILFAHIPLLSHLIDRVLNLIPHTTSELGLRKHSIKGIRSFLNIKIAGIEGDRNGIKTMSNRFFADCSTCIQQFGNKPIQQAYQSDPYFNMALLTELVLDLFSSEERQEMLETSIEALRTVLSNDATSNQRFAQRAREHIPKLDYLLNR